MESFSDQQMAALLEGNLSTAELGEEGWRNVNDDTSGSVAGHYVRWLTIDDTRKSVVDDVRRLRAHPLVSPHVAIYGYLFDVKTGELIEIPEASRTGRSASDKLNGLRNGR
jgi:carbonic anhydrase